MQEISSLCHPTAGVPSAQYVYCDEAGNPYLVANRFDKSNGKKSFIPYDLKRDEWKVSETRSLYNLDKIVVADPATPILFVEGEKCADALGELGYLTTTTFGGSNASDKTDLSPLAGRNIIFWPDYDKAGFSYQTKVGDQLASLRNVTLRCVPISPDMLRNVYVGEKSGSAPYTLRNGWDVADAIAEGWGIEHIDKLIVLATPYVTSTEQADTNPKDVLGDLELWHDPDNVSYVTLKRSGHLEHWPIMSSTFGSFLTYAHYQAEGKTLSQAALEDRKRSLIGDALFAGDEHRVFTRIGEQGSSLFLDLGTDGWNAVEIKADGWRIVQIPAIRFIRSRSMQPLPIPIPDTGDINLLRKFLNVGGETDFRMLVAWLLGCFHPRGPYPILILTGEQGSAKSTTAKVLRSLIDPANPMGRSSPQTEQDLVIAAKHNHVLSFDNLSTIKPAIADALCRVSTGGGFGTRKLHTDSEEVLFNATRPCILNGIPDLANRPDLADRSIIVSLPAISETNRRFESEFWKAFEKATPRILAGLLDAVSGAVGNIGTVTLPERPRMADFAKWVTAAEPALGWTHGAFMESYAANRQSVEDAAIEGNPVAEAIMCLIEDKGDWKGTATELMRVLRLAYPILTEDQQSFPRQANKFSNELRRVMPLLRARDVDVVFERSGKTGRRVILLEKMGI